MRICWGLNGRVLGLKIFEPNGENPYLCGREQCQPEGFTIHMNCCVIFVCFWVIQKELLDLLISPFELILVLLIVN